MMSRPLSFLLVFLAGLSAIGWVGVGYLNTHPLAFTFTLLIGAFYLMGALELKRYGRHTRILKRALAHLDEPPAALTPWLDTLPPGLRHAVRRRVEGVAVALPGPTLTPYIVGMLVLLGMLGTFLGMVLTLRGTGSALESATDLLAIRASLAAPVKGLSFAFGTSIAGVAASAMLGLLSALYRRDRIEAGYSLDTQAATTLRCFSQGYQREATLTLLQQQAAALPQWAERQLASQACFHDQTLAAYRQLTESIAATLQTSVASSAQAAAQALQPIMTATMAGLTHETRTLHQTLSATLAQQLNDLTQAFEGRAARLMDEITTRLNSSTDQLSTHWQRLLTQQALTHDTLAQHNQKALTQATAVLAQQSNDLIQTVTQSHQQLQSQLIAQDETRLTAWHNALTTLSGTLTQQWQQTSAQAEARQQHICNTLVDVAHNIAEHASTHTRATIAKIERLMESAAQAPKAAAEVMAELRQKLSDSLAHDNAVLEERSRLLTTLSTLLDAVNHASSEQRVAVEALLGTSADLMHRVSTQFAERIDNETHKLSAVGAQMSSSAVEVASLGEAFGAAVQQFASANETLATQLHRIESALDKSIARGDEQLSYYVSQAREVVDLSLMSQKQILEDLQQLTALQTVSAEADPGTNTQ